MNKAISSPMDAELLPVTGSSATLRELILSNDLSFLMEAYDGLSAGIAERAGFKRLWASGLSMSFGYRCNDAGVVEVAEATVAVHDDRNIGRRKWLRPWVSRTSSSLRSACSRSYAGRHGGRVSTGAVRECLAILRLLRGEGRSGNAGALACRGTCGASDHCERQRKKRAQPAGSAAVERACLEDSAWPHCVAEGRGAIVFFLCSRAASLMTGQVLFIDGGVSA